MIFEVTEVWRCRRGRAKRTLAPFLLIGALTSCTYGTWQPSIPVKNPKTGQEAVCVAPPERIMAGERALHVLNQCVQACARYGFEPYTGPPVQGGGVPGPVPRAPDDDVKPFVPEACLP